MVFIDVSESFRSRRDHQDTKSWIEVELPEFVLDRFLSRKSSESEEGDGGERSAERKPKHEFYAFADHVRPFPKPVEENGKKVIRSFTNEITKCDGRGEYCVRISKNLIDQIGALYTRIVNALDFAARLDNTSTWTSVIIFTDMVDSCLAEEKRPGEDTYGPAKERLRRGECFDIENGEREGLGNHQTISSLLRRHGSIDVNFVVTPPKTDEHPPEKIRRVRNVLFYRLRRDLGANVAFYLSDDNDWYRYGFPGRDPSIRAIDELGTDLTGTVRAPESVSWDDDVLSFSLPEALEVEELSLACGSRVVERDLPYHLEVDEADATHTSYVLKMRSCSLPICREDEALTLQVRAYNAKVIPLPLTSYAQTCVSSLELTFHEAPGVMKGALFKRVFNLITSVPGNSGAIEVQFELFLGRGREREVVIKDGSLVSPEESSATSNAVSTTLAPVQREASNAISKLPGLRIKAQEVSLDPGSFQCEGIFEPVPRDLHLGLESVVRPEMWTKAAGEEEIVDGRDPHLERVRVDSPASSAGYALALAQIVFAVGLILIALLPLRIFSQRSILPIFALVLGFFPLLASVHPGTIRAALWGDGIGCIIFWLFLIAMVLWHGVSLILTACRSVPDNLSDQLRSARDRNFWLILRVGVHCVVLVSLGIAAYSRHWPTTDGPVSTQAKCRSEISGEGFEVEVQIFER